MVRILDFGSRGLGLISGWVNVLRSWEKIRYSHSAPLHPGVKIGTGKLSGKLHEMPGGNFCNKWHPIQGGVIILLIASCYGNQNKLWLSGSPGLPTDITLT